MPLHDWTDERGWDDVHPLWMTYLLEYVQEGIPEGYKVFLGGLPALTAFPGRGEPDARVREYGPQLVVEPVTSGTGALEPDLEANVTFRLDPQRAVHIDFHGQLNDHVRIFSMQRRALFQGCLLSLGWMVFDRIS